MKTIKFQFKYGKMPEWVKESVLLDVLDVQLADLSPEFLYYDTTANGGMSYQLPKTGMYLLLLLHGNGQLWTTLRRATPEKRKYYRDAIGETFKIEITEAPSC